MINEDLATETRDIDERQSTLTPDAIHTMGASLRVLLADVFALYIKTKNFHWHMRGAHFRDYHLLLDEQADQLFAMSDVIAERSRKLGVPTIHSVGEIARLSARLSFFLPIGLLSHVFRGKFVAGLRSAFHRGELQFHGELLQQAQPRAFAAWLRGLFRHDWVVYSKPPFGGPERVLRYLGAYTHRVPISNSRLVDHSDGTVTFRWRDSAHNNKKRLMTLDVHEFLRRFLLHLLPPGFVRIRNFGFLANRNRAALLPLCFRLLSGTEKITASPASPSTDQTHSLWNCPACGAAMRVVEGLSAAELLLRSPPQPDHCTA